MTPEPVCLRPAGSVWVLDSMQGRHHNTSTDDFESTFTKARDSETRKGLG